MFKKIKIYYLRLRSKILTPRINRDIKKYKYVHVMKNDKFNKPFVDFLNKNFNNDEHMVLCYKACKNKPPTLFPKGKNVYEYVYFKDIKGLLGDNIDKIIFHSLFMPGVIDRLYREPELLKKSYWVIWGGDLYNAPRDEKNDFVRKNFKGYISLITGDEKVAKEKYNSNAFLMKSRYVSFVNKKYLENLKGKNSENIVVQINNSCDESTLEMLDILSKYKDKNIIIRVVLSYGKMQYKSEIIKKGKEIFGRKFEYIDKLISLEDYANFLSKNDILILNQNRQQGGDNILLSLFLGVKVYINSNVTTYKYFKEMGCDVYNTKDIKNYTFEEFLYYPKFIKTNNRLQIIKTYGDENLKEQKKMWNNVFRYKD